MARKRGRSDTHTRDSRVRNRAREDKADGPDSHSSGNQGEQAVLNRPVVNSPENRGMPGIPHHRGIHKPVRWVDQDNPGRFGIRTPAKGGQWDIPSRWGIRSRGERGNSAVQSRPDTHRSRDRSSQEHPHILDIHNRAVGRLGIHSLGTRKQEVRRLGSHQGRAGQDHKGLCRPRGPTPPRQSHREQFGSLSLSRRLSIGRTDERTTDTTHPFSRRRPT
jgi:hypothetical protein